MNNYIDLYNYLQNLNINEFKDFINDKSKGNVDKLETVFRAVRILNADFLFKKNLTN